MLAEHQARKRFGQNFLVDQGVIQRIVRSIAPKASDNLIEIGPGQGAITELLLSACPKLNVVELDRDLIPILEHKFASYPDFTIHSADALKFDFSQLASEEHPLRVVGNLPYNISTPLLFHLLSYRGLVQDMHFMLQKEVVQRLAAEPDSQHYGRLSVMAQYFCRVIHLFDVPPGSFFPPPKVMSAIVRLSPREPEVVANNPELLAKVVNQAFQQRRKTLHNTLKGLVTDEQMEAVGISPKARAETLSVAQFVALANQLASAV